MQNRLAELKVIINHLNGFGNKKNTEEERPVEQHSAKKNEFINSSVIEEITEENSEPTVAKINALLSQSPTKRIIDKLQIKTNSGGGISSTSDLNCLNELISDGTDVANEEDSEALAEQKRYRKSN